MDFRGKTALVTGGAKRLGRAIAMGLARAGANVVVHYHTSKTAADELVASLEALHVRAWAIPGDLADPVESEHLFGRVVSAAGSLDILVNSASIFPESTFQEVNADHLRQNIQVNAWAPLVLSRAFAAQGRRGHIINLLDCRIVDYDARHVAYHVSKRMLFTFTRISAVEFAPDVQVNAVAPGLILPPEGKDESYLQSLAHTNPLQRYGNADDIVRAVLFLLSSDFITGQVIYVDGGRHMVGNFYG